MKNFSLLLTVSLLLVSCSEGTPSSNSSGDTVKIGAILMLSGMGSMYGEFSRNGIELAKEEINEDGGVLGKNIEVLYEDNQGDNAKVAVSGLRKLQQEGISLVIGTNWSPSGLATAPVACENQTVMISPSLGVAGFNEECEYLFNVWPHDFLLSQKLGEVVVQEGYERIAILGSIQEWEKEQAEAVRGSIEDTGGTVVSFQLPQKDQSDFRTEITKIKSANPDVIILTNYAHEGLAAKQIREQAIEVPFYSVLIDGQMLEQAHGALEGAIAITSYTPEQSFKKRYLKRYGEEVDHPADTAYDALMLLAEAIRETRSTEPDEVAEYLNSLEEYSGASGTFMFDGKGGVTKEPRMTIVKDGEIVPYEL